MCSVRRTRRQRVTVQPRSTQAHQSRCGFGEYKCPANSTVTPLCWRPAINYLLIRSSRDMTVVRQFVRPGPWISRAARPATKPGGGFLSAQGRFFRGFGRYKPNSRPMALQEAPQARNATILSGSPRERCSSSFAAASFHSERKGLTRPARHSRRL